MPTVKRTFSLSDEWATYIEAKVASGEYASASEVVRSGLRILMQHDTAVEHWLRETVAARYDASVADPSRGIPIDDVMDEIDALHSQRLKAAE